MFLTLSACGSGDGRAAPDGTREQPATTASPPRADAPTSTAPPGPGTSELLRLLEQGRATTFHARWVAKQESGGGEVRFELWNRPPHGRLDVVIGSSGLSSSAVLNATGAHRCARNGQEPWGCQPGGDVQPAGVILDAVREAVSGMELTASDGTVVGRPARCYTEAASGQEAVCTTTDGIPLRVLSGPQRIDILLLERTVGDEDLQLPGRTGG